MATAMSCHARRLALVLAILSGLTACGSPAEQTDRTDPRVEGSVAAAQPAQARDASTAAAEHPDSTKPMDISGGEAAMMVFRDPETGALVPEPVTKEQREVARAAASELNESTEGLVEVRLPNGAVVVDLQGRFLSHATITVGPDGTRHFDCNEHGEPHSHATPHLEEQ
jgi:hypothetical protein